MRQPHRLIWLWCAIFVVRAAADLRIWQPYFYQYAIMLFTLAVARTERGGADTAATLNVNRLIVAGVYLWSGLNKLNYRFMTAGLEAVPGLALLLSPVSEWISPQRLAVVSMVMPFVETAIGAGLIVGGRWRRISVAAAIAMHALVLLAIGPLGASVNRIVWPWNVAMILLVVLLFRQRDEVRARDVLWNARSRVHQVVFVLFLVCPLLSVFDFWPPSLSFRLYSYRLSTGDIYVTDALRTKLPPAIQAELQPISVYFDLGSAAGTHAPRVGPYVGGLNISDWSERELNAFVPPEPRIFAQVFGRVCALAPAPTDAILLVAAPPDILTGATRQSVYPCPAH
jgi:hypothetical protein